MTHAACHAHGFCAEVCHRVVITAIFLVTAGNCIASPVAELGRLKLDSIPSATFRFQGKLGERVAANVENWLTIAPQRNPGLLEMFALRDAGPAPDLNPWAGEYVGKYLISAIQAMRMSDDPRLRETVDHVVRRLIELQAADGYLGPWPKKERLLGHWDLWGHYHVILGLIMASEQTGNEQAMSAACKAADLVCTTFLDADRRVSSVINNDGPPPTDQMNMAIIHAMTILYRKTGEPRYLRMAQEVLKDFENAGDWYRQGLNGEEYFRLARPRWEGLHSVQGLAELFRITGDETFRRSFLGHWASMRRFDVHNTGGFSSSGQATGNPFGDGVIETCGVVAWQAVMIDALRLTGDATIADDLELTTFNAVAGAQHPSGEWWTYNAPENTSDLPHCTRVAFHLEHAHGRPNAKFLGCCPVNGPRGLGMLSEWAIMRHGDELAVNYYGPMSADVALSDGAPVILEIDTDYPVGDTVRLKIRPEIAKQFTLLLRIPGWSSKTDVTINGQPPMAAKSGEYLKIKRLWRAGDEVVLRLDQALRYESGDLQQAGRVSLYRGPILLCADDRFTLARPAQVDVAQLHAAQMMPTDATIAEEAGPHRPWLVLNVPIDDRKTVRLIDFASAGSTGKGYQTWLSASRIRPPRPVAWQPADGATLDAEAIRFTWREPGPSPSAADRFSVVISDSPAFTRTLLSYGDQSGSSVAIPSKIAAKLESGKKYYWKVIARNEFGEAESIRPYKRFTIDATASTAPVAAQ